MSAGESHRFTCVFVEDVGRRCGRCAHLPHKSLEDVNLYFEFTEVCLFENRIYIFQDSVWEVRTSSTTSSNIFHKNRSKSVVSALCRFYAQNPHPPRVFQIVQVPFFRFAGQIGSALVLPPIPTTPWRLQNCASPIFRIVALMISLVLEAWAAISKDSKAQSQHMRRFYA